MLRWVLEVILVASFLITVIQAGGDDWTYGLDADPNGQDRWVERNPACGGRRQSPIAFWPHEWRVRAYAEKSQRFQLVNFEKEIRHAMLTNNGHTALLLMPDGHNLSMSGGFLPDEYNPVQLHFHWGHHDDESGSEHRIGRGMYPMEMHIVHVNQETRKAEAVLGVFYQLVDDEPGAKNPQLETLVKYFSQIPNSRSYVNMTHPIRISELLPTDLDDFFRYDGSFTTPPCTEGIHWTMFTQVQNITKSQLQRFRYLHDRTPSDYLGDNNRLPQLLNDREIIYYTYQPDLQPLSAASSHFRASILAILFSSIIKRFFC